MIRNTSGILCTEQYNKNTITTLATRQSGKPSIWCSNENNYPSDQQKFIKCGTKAKIYYIDTGSYLLLLIILF